MLEFISRYGFLLSLLTLLFLFLVGPVMTSCHGTAPVVADPPDTPTPTPEENEPRYEVVQKDGVLYVSLRTLHQMADSCGWTLKWHATDRVLELTHNEQYVLVTAGIPVIERSGYFDSIPRALEVSAKDGVLVPLEVLKTGFGWRVEEVGEAEDAGAGLLVRVDTSVEHSWPTVGELPETPDEVVAELGFLQVPIEGAHAGFADSHVPGAARDYRNGTHEGFDWYGYRVGVAIKRDTPVHAMADGTVVRANHDWQTPTPEERNHWLAQTIKVGHTPEWILDLLRGRQVWIMHKNGVLIRYAHLSAISPGVTPGTVVEAGEVIGYVGNSGTAAEANGTEYGLHLHLDILLYGRNIWLQFDPQTMREVMQPHPPLLYASRACPKPAPARD